MGATTAETKRTQLAEKIAKNKADTLPDLNGRGQEGGFARLFSRNL